MIKIKPLVVSIALANAGFALPVLAQQNDTQDRADLIEEVTVTGIRRSLEAAMDIKRDASGVVDAISAEDIGKFPDSNLAESLQRIPGVSIDRRNNEGNQVSVRGFGPSFNMVTLNGRQMPSAATAKQESDSSAEQSRAFNFAEIAAESVNGVNVYKTARADQPTGGIGATVDVRTARPLQMSENVGNLSIKGNMDQTVEEGDEVTPEISGIWSHKLFDERVGILLTGSYSERHSRQESAKTDGWMRVNGNNIDTSAVTSGLGQIWLPRNVVVEQADHERERTNFQGVLQFEPNDRMRLTLDYTMSDYEDKIERSQAGLWIEEGGVGAPNAPSGIADANGTVTTVMIQENFGAGYGALDWQGYSDVEKTENESVGFNFEWDVTDNLSLEFDYHDSTSEAQPGDQISDFLVILSGPLGMSSVTDFSGSRPTIELIDNTSAVTGANTPYTPADYLDPNAIRPNIDLARNKSAKNDVEQFQLHGKWANADEGALKSINFGVSRTEYEIQTGWYFDLGVQGQPQCVVNGSCAGLENMLSVESTEFSDTFPYLLSFNAADVFNTYLDGDNGLPSVFDLLFTNTNTITEETDAYYVQFELETEFNGMAVNILAGMRYEQTDVTGTTLQVSPISMQYVSSTEFRPNYTTEEVEYSLESDYDMWLPSLDVSLEIRHDLMARFSAGRTLTRSDLNSMKPALNIVDARPGGPYGAAQGNPGLIPYESDNLDMSLEWYYAEGSYAAISYFKKWVDNYVVTTITQDTIMGAGGYALTDPNPSADINFPTNVAGGPDDEVILWDISSFENGEAAKVDGIELAVQHMFGDSGFGLQANVTFVDGDVEYDETSLDQTIALTGLSDSANFVGFYEADNWQVRLAYNWRDEFLLSMNQLRQANEPVFVEEYGQWDISASYDINDNFSVFFEGLNIFGEDAKAHGRFDNQFIYEDDQEARFAAGVRVNF
ncbi:TonB-dependent receptor [Pseudomaricurvus alkylphenolicus]|uniref:TonB-dependent receptor n=1 Tax=Pseudomaricurvus alkylphenolicus TaxID=1306991 RepID=UPI001421F75D|nr:TonB-dependent receptor [Pseudomaricurvus alkylphenolicus]NIB39950.1 TonB-dependent receptor [Pseudomaricurvus alkylphenolicus]